MDFSLTEDQQMMVNTAEQIAEKFGPEYWREKDEAEEYPADFLEEIGNQGFFGLPAPEQFGGLNLGLTEVAVVMEALCRGGGGAVVRHHHEILRHKVHLGRPGGAGGQH